MMGIRRALVVALLSLPWTGVLDPATLAPACAEPACRVCPVAARLADRVLGEEPIACAA